MDRRLSVGRRTRVREALSRSWPYHRRLIDADMVYPWDLMRGMDEPTARYLVDLIERDYEVSRERAAP